MKLRITSKVGNYLGIVLVSVDAPSRTASESGDNGYDLLCRLNMAFKGIPAYHN